MVSSILTSQERACDACSFWFSFGLLRNEDEISIYEGYQTLLGVLLTVLTLMIGFTLTGSLLAVNFDGAQFPTSEVLSFVDEVRRSLTFALIGFAIALLISLVGAQLKASVHFTRMAASFFRCFSWAILGSEICLFMSSRYVLSFTATFVRMTYEFPSKQLCPERPADIWETASFCGSLATSLYDAAVHACGQPKQNIIRVPDCDSMNLFEYMCMSVDMYHWVRTTSYYFQCEKENNECAHVDADVMQLPGNKVYFGWSLDDYERGYTWLSEDLFSANYTRFNGTALAEACLPDADRTFKKWYFDYLGDQLGGDLCGTPTLQKARDALCKRDPLHADCVRAIAAFNDASTCATDKSADVHKCFRLCEWINVSWDEGGSVSVVEAFAPFYKDFSRLKIVFDVLICARIVSYVVLLIAGWWACSSKERVPGLAEEEASESADDSGLDDTERQQLYRSTQCDTNQEP